MPYKYMRDTLDEKYGLIPLQNKILEIAVYMDTLCRENGITYYLMGGSALGAKRHGGFIPWDDDLDFFMTPNNYEIFRYIFRINADQKRFYLQEWGAVDGMVTISKVRLNGTLYIEKDFKNWDIHQGIYVDIFILHNCPNQKLLQLQQCFWAKYVIMKGLAVRGYSRKKGFIGLVLKLMKVFPDRKLVKHGLNQIYKYRKNNTDYYCNFLGKAIFKNAIYKKEYFGLGMYVPFEKVELRVVDKIHEFLTDRFGDYMTPPRQEVIKWEQHAESWDIFRDFREISTNCTNKFMDEYKLI